jgi:hypothetical protein
VIVVLGLNAAGTFGSDNCKLLITLTEVVCACVGNSCSELQGGWAHKQLLPARGPTTELLLL